MPHYAAFFRPREINVSMLNISLDLDCEYAHNHHINTPERTMITKTKKNWTTGQIVKVGFLSLVVKSAVATPGDYLPDAYILANQANTQLYKFVPYNGLEKISTDEAKEMLASAERHAAHLAAQAIAKASASREIEALFA